MIEYVGCTIVLGLALAALCGLVLSSRIEAREDDDAARLLECSDVLRARLDRLRRSAPDAGCRDLQAAMVAKPPHAPSRSCAFA